MPLWKRGLLNLLAALPGLGMLTFSAAAFRGEYFQSTYLAGGMALLAGAALAAALLLSRPAFQRSAVRAGWGVALAVLIGWLAALLVMGLLNLTPLCVGVENGDGINDLGMCVFYTLLWAAFYTPLAAAAALACGAAGGLAARAGISGG
jgi:hypothetical protein